METAIWIAVSCGRRAIFAIRALLLIIAMTFVLMGAIVLITVSVPLMVRVAEYLWWFEDVISRFMDLAFYFGWPVMVYLGLAFLLFMIPGDFIGEQRSLLELLLISLLAALPFPVLVIWHRAGVPPVTPYYIMSGVKLYDAIIFIMFVGSVVTTMHVILFPRSPSRFRRATGWLFVVFVNAFFLVMPPAWAIVDARLRLGPVRSSDVKPGDCDTRGRPTIVHISDLHLISDLQISKRHLTRDRQIPGNYRLSSLLRAISNEQPEYLIVSGDITDSGDSDQWVFFRKVLDAYLPHTRVILAPGNHDLNLFFGEDTRFSDLSEEDERELRIEKMPRLARFLLIQSIYMPMMVTAKKLGISHIMQNAPNRTTLPRSEIAEQCRRNCENIYQGEAIRMRVGCNTACSHDWRSARLQYFSRFEKLFPLTYVDEQKGLAFVSILSPSTKTSTPGQNAIGYIDEFQIHALEHFLHMLPDSTTMLILALHHPLFARGPIEFGAPYVSDFRDLQGIWQEIYNSKWFSEIFLQNGIKQASAILGVIKKELDRRSNLEAIIMFGHRHERSLKEIAGIILEGAPNVATENKEDFGFYAVGRDSNRRTYIGWCQVMPPVDSVRPARLRSRQPASPE